MTNIEDALIIIKNLVKIIAYLCLFDLTRVFDLLTYQFITFQSSDQGKVTARPIVHWNHVIGSSEYPLLFQVDCLYYHAGGLGAILRSGLGWLGAANTKQHPR